MNAATATVHDQWQAAWPQALAVWSRFTRLRDPLLCATSQEAAAAAARSYAEAFQQSQDAVGKMVHDTAGLLGSAKLWLDEQLRRGER